MPKIKLLILLSIIILSFVLRVYKLDQIPKSLHGDEIQYLYNAYSLATTGKDEYGITFPFTFRNDANPLVFYLSMPFALLFGLNEFMARFPTVIINILMLLIIYKLVIILFKNQKIALLTIFLISISSWHIRSSRQAIETSWALTFQIIGIVLFIQSVMGKKYFLLLSFISFGLSIISYQSTKMTTPLIIFGLLVIYRTYLKQINLRKILLYFILFIIIPLLVYFLVKPIPEMRFAGINILLEWKKSLPVESPLYLPHNIFILLKKILLNYFNLFNPKLLFFDNSNLRYYQLHNLGLFYSWQIIFIIIGIYTLLKRVNLKEYKLLLYWILISPIPASLTIGMPYAHIGRNLMMFPVIEIITCIGIYTFYKVIQKYITGKFISIIKIFFIIICTIYLNIFLYQYFIISAREFINFWGFPYKKIIPLIIPYETTMNKIIITNVNNSQSYLYLLFYGQRNPKWLLTQTREKNKIIGFSKIANYEFRPIDWNKDQNLPNSIIVGTNIEIPQTANNIIYEYKNPNNLEVLLRVVKTN